MMINFYWTIWCHVPEDCTPHVFLYFPFFSVLNLVRSHSSFCENSAGSAGKLPVQGHGSKCTAISQHLPRRPTKITQNLAMTVSLQAEN
jgi:hypothetical protein